MKIKNFSTIFILVSILAAVSFSEAAKETVLDCAQTFVKTGICSPNLCQTTMNCQTSAETAETICQTECVPKDCLEINSQDCPQDRCILLTGCSQGKVCFPSIEEIPQECGELSYQGEKECCEGFIKRCGVEFLDGSCDMLGTGSMDSVPMCLPCGNGICNQFENGCNCPEDCSQEPPSNPSEASSSPEPTLPVEP